VLSAQLFFVKYCHQFICKTGVLVIFHKMARRVSGKRKKGKCVRRARLGQLGGGVAAAMSADLEKNNKRYVSP
jgi:hypothetical protein